MSWSGAAPVLTAVAVAVVVLRLAPLAAGPRLTGADTARTGRVRWPLQRRRRPAAGDLDIAEWCEHVARCLRGGQSLARSLDDAAVALPLAAAEFEGARHALRRGRSLPVALASLDADPSRPAGLVVPVLRACAELGGPAAAPLDRVAVTLQARAAARAERATSSAQARMSARVLTTLPVAMLALLALADGSVRSTLATPAGMVCVAVGGCCNVAGWWWMRRITNGDEP